MRTLIICACQASQKIVQWYTSYLEDFPSITCGAPEPSFLTINQQFIEQKRPGNNEQSSSTSYNGPTWFLTSCLHQGLADGIPIWKNFLRVEDLVEKHRAYLWRNSIPVFSTLITSVNYKAHYHQAI